MAEDFSYLGSGIILIREWNTGAPFDEVGNCSAFSVSPKTNTIELADNQNPGGGIANRVDRVTGYDVAYTFHDFNKDNFARTTRGVATTVAAGAVPDEAVRTSKGRFVPLKFPATEITSVKLASAPATIYEKDKDYVLRRGMLFIPADSMIADPGNGSAAANVVVAYKHGELGQVEAGVRPQRFYEMQFIGTNEARGGKQVRLVAHKVSGGMIEQLGLLGDQFGAGSVTGALVKDTDKATTDDKSAYFFWQQEN